MMALSVEQVAKTYEGRSGSVAVLRSVNLTMEAGESAAIMGPSGSGKSTLLHLIGTLDKPSTGTIRFDDIDPFALSDRDLAAFRNRRIGFVFQDHHLLPQCTVLENVLMPTMVNPEPGIDWVKRAEELLERVGLSARKDHRPAELSGGERQRAAVARALIRKPSAILADEPTGNLDAVNAHSLGELLTALPRETGAMLLVVTHSADLAARFAKRFVVADGKLVPSA